MCDPIDKSSLRFYKITEKDGQDIISGILKSKSGNIYQIKDGVPILLTVKTQSIESVESFAYEWEQFDYDYGKKGWLQDIVKPLVGSGGYFKNKTIIDCGAGSGRQSLWMAESGAKMIFSVELSGSARTMVRKVTQKYKNKVFVIQADLANMPINKKNAGIDTAYCINVIQHTKNPLRTTREISSFLNRKSEFLFNIYLKRNNDFFLNIVESLKKILDKFPKPFIKYVSLVIAICAFPIKVKGHNFKEFWLDVYDLIGTHSYQKFYTEEYLNKFLNNLGLKITKRSYYAMVLTLI